MADYGNGNGNGNGNGMGGSGNGNQNGGNQNQQNQNGGMNGGNQNGGNQNQQNQNGGMNGGTNGGTNGDTNGNFVSDTEVLIWADNLHKNWGDRFRLFGLRPSQFSLEGFFINDYKGCYDYDDYTGLPTNHNTDTYQQNINIFNQILVHPDITMENKQKAFAMKQRYSLTNPEISNWPSTDENQLIEELETNVYNYFYYNNNNVLGTPLRNEIIPLGPAAPKGYTQVVGKNYASYFNVNMDMSGGGPTPPDVVPFLFTNTMAFGQPNIDENGYYLNSPLIDAFNNYLELNGITWNQPSDLFMNCQAFVDEQLWTYFFQAYISTKKIHNSLQNQQNQNGGTDGGSNYKPTELFYEESLGLSGITLEDIQQSTIVDATEKNRVLIFRNVVISMYNKYVLQLSTGNEGNYFHPNRLFAPFTGLWSVEDGATSQEISNPSEFDSPLPPIGDNFNKYKQYGWSDWIKLNLLNLTTQQGGIQNNETFNFITYCALGGTIYIPSDFNSIIPGGNLIPPPLINQMNFSQEMGIVLNPGTNIITYYGPDFTGQPSWKEADYMNNLFQGQIMAVYGGGGTQGILYSNNPVYDNNNILVLQDGGYYPSDDTGDTILKYGNTIQIEVFEGQPAFSTEAFGTIADIYGEGNYFPAGTSLITMIQTLLFEGYNGETLDYNSDGSITLEDCELILEHTGDYKPFQFVNFCQQSGLLDIIYEYFSPDGTNVNPFTNEQLDDFGLPPIPHLFNAPVTAIKTFDATKTLVRNRTRGYFKGNPGLNETAVSSLLTNNQGKETFPHYEGASVVQNELGSRYITGNSIFTQSRNTSNDPYGYVILDGDSNKTDSEPIFSVSFGHYLGSGSFVQHTGSKSPSYAVYKQWANTLLGTEEGHFFSISGSLVGTTNAPSSNVNSDQSQTANPDEYIYILSSMKKGDKVLDKNIPEFKITLSGSKTSGQGNRVTFVSDYLYNPGGFTQKNGLVRYNIIKGTSLTNSSANISPTSASFGYFYPDMGVWIFNQKIEEYFGGVDTTTQVSFNTTTTGDNGLKMNGSGKFNKEYNNALKFVNALKNNDENNCIENLTYQNEEYSKLCIAKIGRNELNYSLNKTRNAQNGQIRDFSGSMTYEEGGSSSPTTFANSIQLYDATGYMIAIGNLSVPIKKDFNSEVVIKVIVPS